MHRLLLCRKCGTPWLFKRFFDWTGDGTIIGRDKGRSRAVFIEVDEVRSLISGVSERIGFNIDHIVFTAEKEVGRRVITTGAPSFLPLVPRNRLTRPMWFGRLMARIISLHVAIAGVGRIYAEGYDLGRSATIRLVNPHVTPFVAGDAAGGFEFLERMDVDGHWEECADGTVLVTIEKVSETPPAEKRLSFEPQTYLPGNVEFERCPGCRTPKDVSLNLAWDLKEGAIENRVTGGREALIPAQSFVAVFRELEKEIGEEIPALLERTARMNAKARYATRGLPADAEPLDLIRDFAWRGMGNPVRAELTEGGADMTVENPFNPVLVTGRIAGLFEARWGCSVSARWDVERPGRLTISLEKEGGGE